MGFVRRSPAIATLTGHADDTARSRGDQEGEGEPGDPGAGLGLRPSLPMAPRRAYLGTIALAALVGKLPPLIFKALIDGALPPVPADPGLVDRLFVAAVVVAVAITALNLVNRWLGSRIGEA